MRRSCRIFDVVVVVVVGGDYPSQLWPWMIELNTIEMLNMKSLVLQIAAILLLWAGFSSSFSWLGIGIQHFRTRGC